MKPDKVFLLNTECMDFLERDLEEIIFNADKNELADRGLCLYGKMFRQLRIGNYGVADLVTAQRRNNTLIIEVVELKKDKIGVSAFIQAVGYAKGIADYLEWRGFHDYYVNISLIGKEIDRGNFLYLADILPQQEYSDCFYAAYTYQYDVDGIKFKLHSGYSLINKGWENE